MRDSIAPTTVLVSPFLSIDPNAPTATTAYQIFLPTNGNPIATVLVFPYEPKILILPKSDILAPGPSATTFNGLIISVDATPLQIVYRNESSPASTPSVSSSYVSTIDTTTTMLKTTISTTIPTPTPISTLTAIPIPRPTEPLFSTTTDTTIALTSSSAATSPPRTSSTRLDGGALAGIAIGCLVAGALVASIMFRLCWNRHKSARFRDTQGSVFALTPYSTKAVTKDVSLEDESLITTSPNSSLPQPLEDKAISGHITKIYTAIKNHVQSYYYTGLIRPGLIDYHEDSVLSSDMPISIGTLHTLLENSTTREIALQFCIAWVIVSMIQGGKGQLSSLLPPEIAQCSQSMATAGLESKAHVLLMARWRVLTAELMQYTYVRRSFSSSDSRNSNVRATVGVLDSTLQPYADARIDNEQRKRNLEEIIKRSALFAYTLFSQPSSWDFDWKGEQGVRSDELCIFPALVQVTDEVGEPIRPPRVFSEAVVRQVDV